MSIDFATKSGLTVALLLSLALPLAGQRITVRVLNGKSGKPMPDRNVTVQWLSGNAENTVIRMNRVGEAEVAVPEGEHSFILEPGPKDGKEPGRVAYIDCNATRRPSNQQNYPTGMVEFPVKKTIEQGVVPFNWCSKRTVAPMAGVAIFWGKPIPWYIPDMQ